jgi:hypothetical protein
MAANGKMTSKERVRRALEGADIDRPPFSLWHHFGLQAFRRRSIFTASSAPTS